MGKIPKIRPQRKFEREHEMWEANQAGISRHKIAEDYGVSFHTVSKVIQRHKEFLEKHGEETAKRVIELREKYRNDNS